jgi:type IV secretion system protein VirB9
MSKKKYKFLIFCILYIYISGNAFASKFDTPIAIDSRIKTFVYSENEIFPIVLNYGYQTAIEFSKDEIIQTYSVGNQFVWQFSAVGRTLFIKPLEENIVTNMTVLTNKRRYYFELYSKLTSGTPDEELSYVVRFFYPDEEKDIISAQNSVMNKEQLEDVTPIKPYNFNYKISGPGAASVLMVFDNDINTFLKMPKQPNSSINVVCEDKQGNKKTLQTKMIGHYFMINKVCTILQTTVDSKLVTIHAKESK